MKVIYVRNGAVATITITSSVFEFRKHNHCVDVVLQHFPAGAYRSGFFSLKSVISGESSAMLRAYRVVGAEDAR